MIKTTVLLPGDVLLFPTKQPNSLYDQLSKILGYNLTELLYVLSNQKYIHQELLIKGRYTLSQTQNGVYIIRRNLEDFRYITVLRHKEFEKITLPNLIEVIKKYWNVPYDFTQLFMNVVQEFFSQLPLYEQLIQDIFQKKLNYNKPNQLICSEVIQRIYHDLGLKVSDEPLEFVSPQDLQESKYFNVVWEQETI